MTNDLDQGRQYPDDAGHTDGDADGLGLLRGLAVALVAVAAIAAAAYLAFR